MNSTAPIITQEISRSLVYRRLADAFRPPEPGLPGNLAELRDHLDLLESEGFGPVDAMCAALNRPSDFPALELDFAALFVGPFLVPAPPYGSVYLEGVRRLMGDSTMDARAHYRAVGLDTADHFKEPPDHIAAELEFMHVLVCQGIEAIRKNNREALLDGLKRQQTFLLKHLGAWVPDFTEKVAEYAGTGFYRHLADATRRFIGEEIEAFGKLSLPKLADIVV
ncbi:MAG: TorD/DmsD family molecular chaperone [Desulfobacterales bacterium]